MLQATGRLGRRAALWMMGAAAGALIVLGGFILVNGNSTTGEIVSVTSAPSEAADDGQVPPTTPDVTEDSRGPSDSVPAPATSTTIESTTTSTSTTSTTVPATTIPRVVSPIASGPSTSSIPSTTATPTTAPPTTAPPTTAPPTTAPPTTAPPTNRTPQGSFSFLCNVTNAANPPVVFIPQYNYVITFKLTDSDDDTMTVSVKAVQNLESSDVKVRFTDRTSESIDGAGTVEFQYSTRGSSPVEFQGNADDGNGGVFMPSVTSSNPPQDCA